MKKRTQTEFQLPSARLLRQAPSTITIHEHDCSLSPSASSDHPVRPVQNSLRNREADLLGGFKINRKLKRRRCSTGGSAGLANWRRGFSTHGKHQAQQ